ncbi:MAG TPA: hypothetical protein EYN69_07520 [Flavobacteriales bacterium]|nr:hypothetical protein [Flavobacteriales bacterium]
MKFQKTIVNNRRDLSAEQAAREKKEADNERNRQQEVNTLEARRAAAKKKAEDITEEIRIRDRAQSPLGRDGKLSPLFVRTNAYPRMATQLDMLWHDIDSGKISADKTSTTTWYHKIKMLKENNPLPK